MLIRMRGWLGCTLCVTVSFGCGDNQTPVCEATAFEVGDDGHPDPLGAQAGQARAGRVTAGDLPSTGLELWEAGDFVVANDRVAMVIEDAGPSDHYDPYGGRPVGIARVENGALVDPPTFGEFFVLTGRYTVATQSVSVVADGTDGGPAIVRASGFQTPLPFFENLVGPLLRDDVGDIVGAIEYVLEPDAEYVDVFVIYRSPRERATELASSMHGFIFADRMPQYAPGFGFRGASRRVPFVAFVDDDATSYTYEVPGETLGAGVSASGFTSSFTGPVAIGECGTETRRHYTRVTIGGPGLDGALSARARAVGEAQREITGVVRDDAGNPVAGARVHAESPGLGYITRSLRTGADGAYALHVPESEAVDLTAFVAGSASVGPVSVAVGLPTADFAMPRTGAISLTASDADSGVSLPVRVTIYPSGTSAVPPAPGEYGEPDAGRGRLRVVNAVAGVASIPVPAGQWDVVVSRGYEWEIYQEQVDVPAGGQVDVAAVLPRAVDTTGQMCADFHIHTHQSPDSPDDATEKVRSAVADGLEIPVRSEHEYVAPFQDIVQELGLEDWAYGVTSVEMSSMEVWGHMGVLPLEPDPSAPNQGAPLWQQFPFSTDQDREVVTLSPPVVFDRIRARPERPIIIINHPRGGANYFEFVGFDPMTGLVDQPDDWDETFRVVEVFNDSGWRANFAGTVTDWLGLLDSGRPVFAVGSSDSHKIRSSPVGYPRTCLELGTDDPRQLSPDAIRDVTNDGHSTVSGGIYLQASVGGAGPGDTVTTGPSPVVSVTVQAASWIAVDWLEVVVDGEVVDQIAVLPSDADPTNPAIRYAADIPIAPKGGVGSYVIVAAYGETDLAPVHPTRLPFAVSNPIFLE